MRICHVIDYFHTDLAYQEYYLALEQARQGHEVTVVTSTHRQHTVATPVTEEEDARGAEVLLRAGVTLVRLPARQLGHDRAWISDLGRTIRRARPDVLHVHGPFAPTTWRAVREASRSGIGVLVDNHIQDAIAPGATTPAGRAYYGAYRRLLGPSLRRHVGRWIANGPYEGRFLSDRMGLPAGDVGLVPLGFDPSVHRYDRDRRSCLRARWTMEDDLVIALTGKLHERKRADLAAAAAETQGRLEPVRLVIAGQLDPGVEAAVRRAAPGLDAQGRIELRPMLVRQELADLYLASDVVLFPRLPSISIYEAAGTGALVLAPPDDFGRWLAGLHPGIQEFGTDPLRRPPDRSAWAAEAVRAFAWASIAAAFVDLYTDLGCASPS